ncbi:MAG: U32 family peptidase, partial [Anaerotignum sp.]|nr:U32 family peptidase [Anaerotignum sp.]
MGVDALIMQDAGAAKLVKEHFPDFPLHASTQMTCNSLADVKYWESQGFNKIVLSRELSIEEIKHITENVDAEIETFVHGALCVCYSGQCIMSSILGGRSGNRGRCAQTCRLPYTLYRSTENMAEGHLLSPKDIMTVNILPELIEAGIASLKIEGRMKSPEYVAGVTGIYRKYIDLYFEDPENYEVDKEDIKALNQLFNRGGFTEGYYTSFAGRDMMSIERPKPWGLKVGIVDKYLPKHKKVTIRTREPLVPGDGLEVWTQEEPHVGTNVSKHSKAGEVITITMEGEINKNDVVYRTFGKALNDELKKSYERDTRKMPISGMLRVKEGEPISLQLWDNGGNSVFVSGAVVEPAGSSPMLPMKLRELVNKMGATPFVLENLETDIDQYIFVSVSEVNRVRREACEALEASILKKSKRKAKSDAVYAKAEKRP